MVAVFLGLHVVGGAVVAVLLAFSYLTSDDRTPGHDRHPAAPMVDGMVEQEARRQGARLTPDEKRAARDAIIDFHDAQRQR